MDRSVRSQTAPSSTGPSSWKTTGPNLNSAFFALVYNDCRGIGKQFDVKGVARKAIEYARSSRGRAGEWMLQALSC
jgi:hypothetical protein